VLRFGFHNFDFFLQLALQSELATEDTTARACARCCAPHRPLLTVTVCSGLAARAERPLGQLSHEARPCAMPELPCLLAAAAWKERVKWERKGSIPLAAAAWKERVKGERKGLRRRAGTATPARRKAELQATVDPAVAALRAGSEARAGRDGEQWAVGGTAVSTRASSGELFSRKLWLQCQLKEKIEILESKSKHKSTTMAHNSLLECCFRCLHLASTQN
jgi:hypothetical protein